MAELPTSYLVCILQTGSHKMKRLAIKILGERKEKSAIPDLVSVFLKEINLRRFAAEALGNIGTNAREAMQLLVYALIDRNAWVRKAAYSALEKIDCVWNKTEEAQGAIPYFIKALKKNHWEVRKNAIQALDKICQDDASHSTIYILNTYGLIGKASQNHASYRNIFILALKDSSREVRDAALQALEKRDTLWHKTEQAKSLIGLLAQDLANTNSHIRKATKDALEKIDTEWHKTEQAKESLLTLAKALKNGETIYKTATEFLEKIDPAWNQSISSPIAIRYLLKGLGSRYNYASTILALEKIDPEWHKSPEAKTAIPYLIFLLAKNDLSETYWPEYYQALKQTLEKIDPNWHKSGQAKASIPYLLKLLKNGRLSIVSSMLEKIAPDWYKTQEAKAGIPHLICCCIPRTKETMAFAMESLNKIDPEWLKSIQAKTAIPLLVQNLQWHSSISEPSLEMLEKIHPEWYKTKEGKDSILELIKRIRTRAVSGATASMFGKIGAEAKSIIPVLIRTIHSEEAHKEAAAALDKIDPQWHRSKEARSLVPYLIISLGTSSKSGFQDIVDALEKIHPGWHKSREARGCSSELVKCFGMMSMFHGGWKPDNTAFAENALDKIDPDWRNKSKNRSRAIPWLVRHIGSIGGIYGNFHSTSLDRLEKIIPEWYKTQKPADLIPIFLRCLGAAEIDEKASKRILDYLNKIHPEWPKTPEAKSCIPDILKRMNITKHNLLSVSEIKEKEAFWKTTVSVLDMIDSKWHQLPEAESIKNFLLKNYKKILKQKESLYEQIVIVAIIIAILITIIRLYWI